MTQLIQQYDGQGGNPTTIDLSRGNQFFVRYPSSHGATVYLYDKNRKIHVPFPSEQAFETFNGGRSVQEAAALGDIYDLSQPLPGIIVPDNKGFGDNGQVVDSAYFQNVGDVTGLDGAYGKKKNTDLENTAANYLGATFTTLKRNGAISQQTFDNYIASPQTLAKYINAWVYGGYDLEDVYRDVKAAESGITAKPISNTIPASDYYKTADYATAHSNAALNPPTNLGMDSSLFTNPIFNIPNEAFSTIVPAVDINSPGFKTEAAGIKDSYYDLLMQQLNAKTDQEKILADDNYKTFKEQLAQKYGIALSDDASAAWKQVTDLGANISDRGLTGSGVYNELLDRTLADRRLADQRLRTSQTTESDVEKRKYYLTQATPEQIKNDLTDQERQDWGLVPSQSTMDFINNLKTQYPDLSDQDIQNMRNSIVDQNGTLYSSLYQNLNQNRYNLTQQKSSAQQQTLLNQKLSEEQKAYAPYTNENPFVRFDTPVTPAAANATSQPNEPTVPFNSQETVTNQPLNTSQPTSSPPPNDTVNYNGQKGHFGGPSGNTFIPNDTSPPPENTSGLLQMPPGYPASTPTPSQQPATQSANTARDLSNQYGLNNGTVYNLKSGLGYSKPEEFFKDAGVNSFDNVKFNTDYKPSFYKYQDNPTVYNSYNNAALNYDDYLKSGGNKQFTGIETRNR